MRGNYSEPDPRPQQHEQVSPDMHVGDILLWRDEKFGRHRAWRVVSILIGAENTESLIEMESMFERPGADADGKRMVTVLVPEVLTRGLTIFGREALAVQQ